MRTAIEHIKKTGKLPDTHTSHDHLNVQTSVPLPMGMTEFWRERFTEAIQKRNAEHGTENEVINWAIMDGFLLYYDKVSCFPCDSQILSKHIRRIYQMA